MTVALDRTPALTLERLGPTIGAEVSGVDVMFADDVQIAALRAALVDHKVLILRGQNLDDEQQIHFARRLGEVTYGHPVWDSGDVPDEVYSLDSTADGFADTWHTDVTFMARPPAASILRPIILPGLGGDTSWADGEAGYRSLSEPLQRLADGLVAVHDGNREFGYYLRHRRGGEGNSWDGRRVTELEPVRHPVVRVHPESGRKTLFVNPGFTSHIEGVSDAESRGLLDAFYAHLTKPEHIVRHRWRLGDVVLWDNRSTLHYANRDYTERRRMHRVTLRGDVPVGVI
ncbi:TauD/TfdA family dioxygenase [Gordonia sp. (in: high G+C Gram-positive bacteria)]|uniref:TauD/TfdA dioxygenase family protein n=1 Tax=Gordonia sp. (in: high G+C Gram-positive bacteria) TaxID=84139 RepID=UPI0016A561B2|nr:TauD/TfdA family dioxygenase [Gordonia sp. (in: high G+C Gram-positive bacteria)]NLG46438.1 taurine dioxygenase [Gordonia sp. (in: high G+C Gram-positive bacteria)]